MIPNPLPFLAYMAGRTSRVGLGSIVVVLPWHYAKIADRLERSGKDDAAQFYIDLHVKGTPAQCLERLEWIKNATGAEALLSFFSYSGIRFAESRRGLLLHSEEVLPTVGAWT